MIKVSAIIAAAGRGARMGSGTPKQDLSLGGTTILQRTVTAFDRSGRVDEIVLVVPPPVSGEDVVPRPASHTPLRIVTGGRRRQDSVALGFDAVSPDVTIVVIHDAARPLCSSGLIARTIDAAAKHGAAIAAIGTHDTVKRLDPDEGEGQFVGGTLARETIALAQTPQAFRREVLAAAIALGREGAEATDEATLVERAGHRVALVAGEPRNIKITTPDDLAMARQLVRGADAMITTRVGFGYDLHRLVGGRALILGGIAIPHDRGLLGHSDADAVCHALTDAILGAAAAGDIGQHFPDTDPRWKDAASLQLLRAVVDLVRSRGFAVVNVDVVIVAEQPKVGPYVGPMREALAGALGIDETRISIKGKTNEGMDATGRGEAIAVHAVAMLDRSEVTS
ncbi:MAG: 2-C-methyl-D-erythritol 4-phosphate cytidylyltransferase [Acidobacteria bacterium]|nr:2-C-methyl-D-erythritol 4-phosphate cytidylyltransferase [Acidobacteriota bacterium]